MCVYVCVASLEVASSPDLSMIFMANFSPVCLWVPSRTDEKRPTPGKVDTVRYQVRIIGRLIKTDLQEHPNPATQAH